MKKGGTNYVEHPLTCHAYLEKEKKIKKEKKKEDTSFQFPKNVRLPNVQYSQWLLPGQKVRANLPNRTRSAAQPNKGSNGSLLYLKIMFWLKKR